MLSHVTPVFSKEVRATRFRATRPDHCPCSPLLHEGSPHQFEKSDDETTWNLYINQRDAQVLMNSLYFFVKWLYAFRTIISPSSGATFNKLYSAIGTCRYVWLLCGYRKDYSEEFVHLVGLYTHCNMMHGTYNVKLRQLAC